MARPAGPARRVDSRMRPVSSEAPHREGSASYPGGYLDKKYGPDGRMRDWSYSWATRMLKRLGFRNVAQLEACIAAYDDDAVSRALHGQRQGQLSRMDDAVMAGMGENYIRRHPFSAGAADSDGVNW